MQAIILAAGRGSRMMPLTSDTPKCLVKYAEKEILSYSLNAIIETGISNINIVIGYQGEKIVQYCQQNFPKINFNFINNFDWNKTNSLFSLKLALDLMHKFSSYLILEADIIYDKSILDELLSNKLCHLATVVHPYEKNLSGTFATIDDIGNIQQWKHETQREKEFELSTSFKTVNITLVNTNFAHNALTLEVNETLSSFGENTPLEYAMDNLLKNNKSVPIQAVTTNGQFWEEFDTPNEIQASEKRRFG